MPAARQVQGLPVDTDIDTGIDSSTKRYSMFDQLDNIALSSPELSLAPSGYNSTSRRVDEETIRRLSDSLQNLVSQKHGLNHLPELPIPTYDNGNIDLTAVTAVIQPSPTHDQDATSAANPAIIVSKPCARTRSISDISSELDEAVDARTFRQPSHPLAHLDSPVPSRYGSIRGDYGDNRSSSVPRSRPVSMYGTSSTRRVKSHPRPDTAGAQPAHAKVHKKAISYSEQRYSPTRQQDVPHYQHLFVQHDSTKHQAQSQRRFLHWRPSFKNLHAQAKSHAKRLTVEEKPVTHVKPKGGSTQLLDIHAALRGISPRHDRNHDEQFALECQEMLHPKPESRQRQASIPQMDSISQDIDSAACEGMPSVFRHASNISEAPTVDTNILNWDWPQPPTTHPALPTEKLQLQQQHKPTHAAQIEPAVQDETCKYTMAPSPPPTYPLPPVPSAAGSPTKQPSKKSLVDSITSAAIVLPFKKYNLSHANKSQSKTNNRINAHAADRGLSLDAGSSAYEVAEAPVVDPLPSPLNARFNQSSRNSKVRELKKRHLSLLVKDTPVFLDTNHKPQDQAELGQGSSEAPMSIYSSTKMSIPRKLVASDQRKPLPLTPGSARYRGSGESFTGVTKANIGKSRHARNTSMRSKRNSRQMTEAEQNSLLAHSGVMVMVDSSPRQSRDFRAGAIRISGTPRRKASLGRNQVLPALRYQPPSRKKVQPRKLSSPPATDRNQYDASSLVSKIEIGPQQVTNDTGMAFTDAQTGSGAQSPSKASSILEPSPFHESLCHQDTRQSESSTTPVRYVKEHQYVSVQNGMSAPCTPPNGQDRSICSISRRHEIEHLTNEINRMVNGNYGPEQQKEIQAGPKYSSAPKPRSDRKNRSRAQSAPKKSSSSMMSTNEILARIEADLVKAALPTFSLPVSSKRMDRTDPPVHHEDSDMSLTPKSSFQSTSSESSKKQRKNSDASMTDPNEYDPVPCLPKTSNRLVLIPTPPRQRNVDTTAMRSKKRYSNMPTWTAYGKVTNKIEATRETPYSFRKHEQRSLFPPKQMTVSSNLSIGYGSPDSDSDIELNHFLTEADQMDTAIDNFLESTSSNGSCRSRSRSGSGSATPQRQLQLRPNTASRDQHRHSAMSNISNIVDLQRIQDQINNAGQDHGYGYRHGACRETEGFGMISLVARPSTT